ncbi:hypothetical protein SRHO_G00072100 [Serrasalmus rhombeus]
MEEEIQQLRDLVLQLKADNERLLKERATASTSYSIDTQGPPVVVHNVPPATASAVTERLVVIPRDRKCPLFNGKTGIGIVEWIEEIQQAFFSRKQQEGETLQEFSLALMALMESVKQHAPEGMLNGEVLLRDQFIEHVVDGALRRELKQFVRRQPTATLLEVRGEALRWEREGLPGSARGRSFSLPSAYGLQYGVHGGPRPVSSVGFQPSELGELKDMLKRQQEQLNHLTRTVASLQTSSGPSRPSYQGRVVCRRCQQPGHFARECDGERVFPPPRAPPQNVSRSSCPPQPEN